MGMIEWDVYMESMLMNSGALDDAARVFREAAEAFGDIVSSPEVGKAWEQPSALEGLTVGGIPSDKMNAGIGSARAAAGRAGPDLSCDRLLATLSSASFPD